MKISIILLLLVGLLGCQSGDSTQNVRDNETPVAAPDVTNNKETEPDTTATIADTTGIR